MGLLLSCVDGGGIRRWSEQKDIERRESFWSGASEDAERYQSKKMSHYFKSQYQAFNDTNKGKKKTDRRKGGV
jgi:hypothetical protein